MTNYAFFSAIEQVCIANPASKRPIFSELNFRPQEYLGCYFEKLEVRLQTKMITDKNNRWSAKLIVYRQK